MIRLQQAGYIERTRHGRRQADGEYRSGNPGTGTHTDPGPGFPWDKFLALVREAVDGKPAKPVAWSRTLVYTKSKPMQKGADVEAWQALLGDMGLHVDVDGLYGPASAAATKKLQAKAKLPGTGKVDKATWEAGHDAAAK